MVGTEVDSLKQLKKVGHVGKMTATVPDHNLLERLNTLSRKLAPFPPGSGELINTRKQATRLIKVLCSYGLIFRASPEEVKRDYILHSLCNEPYEPILNKKGIIVDEMRWLKQ